MVKIVFGIKEKSEENILQIFKILEMTVDDLDFLEKIFAVIYFVSINNYQ